MGATKAKYQELDSRDIVSQFFPAFEVTIGGMWAVRIAFRVTSDRETENYKWPGASGGLKLWEGNRKVVNPRKFEFTIRNQKFEDTMVLPLEDLRRDKTSFLRARAGEMGAKAAEHWQKLSSATIEENPDGYDGRPLYSGVHDETGENQTNDLGVTEVPSSNVADADNPTPEEMSRIILQIIGHQYTLVDDQKEPTNGDARSFMFMVKTPSYWGAISQAITADRLAGGQSNVLLAANLGLKLEVVLNPRLEAASDRRIFNFRTDGNVKGLILQEEEEMVTQLLGVGSDYEFDNDAHKFGVKATRATGPGEWKYTSRTNIT